MIFPRQMRCSWSELQLKINVFCMCVSAKRENISHSSALVQSHQTDRWIRDMSWRRPAGRWDTEKWKKWQRGFFYHSYLFFGHSRRWYRQLGGWGGGLIGEEGWNGFGMRHLQTKPHSSHLHTHSHTHTPIQAFAALILNTPLAIIIFI